METSKEKKISQLTTDFNIRPDLAKEMLTAHSWNYEAAVGIARYCEYTSKPTGTQKNIEKNLNTDNTPAQKIPIVGGGSASTSSPLPETFLLTLSEAERPLRRGFSRTSENEALVSKAQDRVQKDCSIHQLQETPMYTFVIPDLSCYPEDFRAFLHKQLIETSTLVTLEQAGRLNWWADTGACQRLMPLATIGDGNCLLHAASLGMWGFQDRKLMLRKAVYNMLVNTKREDSLFRRWRWQQTMINKQSGLIYSEKEWNTEWQNLLKLASDVPRSQNLPSSRISCCQSPATRGLMERHAIDEEVFYESLEEFHVFVLAHVVKRPIIVVADTVLKDTKGEALAPIPFGGIYLPLQVDVRHCYRSPLILTYDSSHFSALLAVNEGYNDAESGFYSTVPSSNASVASSEEKPPAVIPIVDPEFKLQPIHFTVDPGPNYSWTKDNDIKCEDNDERKLNLIKKYLDIVAVPIPRPSSMNGDSSTPRSDSESAESEELNSLHVTSSLPSGTIINNISGQEFPQQPTEKEKAKVGKQMQNVAKSFGNISKSVGKKIKKGFGGLRRSRKKKMTELANNRRVSVGSVTQTTKMQPVTAKMLSERDSILCAKLNIVKADYYDKMIENYIASKKDAFAIEKEHFKQREAELKERTAKHVLDTTDSINANKELSRGKCINGCNKVVCQNTYLCLECFEKQKLDLLNIEQSHPNSPSTMKRTEESQMTKNSTSIPIKHEFTPPNPRNIGKSTFYQAAPAAQDTKSSAIMDSKKFNSLPPMYRAKYLQNSDNEQNFYTKFNDFAPFEDRRQEERCKNPHCEFYGSVQTENYCSTCFKSRSFRNIQL